MDVPLRRDDDVSVIVCDDGPLLVRGDVTVVGPDGAALPRSRRTVALCRCGRTGITPWCDGSHKLAPRRPRPAEGA